MINKNGINDIAFREFQELQDFVRKVANVHLFKDNKRLKKIEKGSTITFSLPPRYMEK